MEKHFSAEISEKTARYLERTFLPEEPLFEEIRARSKARELPQIHVGPLDGLHLEVLTRAVGAHKAVEIGTLAGYSGVRIALNLAPGGTLYTFDSEASHMEVARESFRKAGLFERVQTFVGPALENLSKIVAYGPFDLVFVDADKTSYPAYLEWATENLRVGGLLIGDNTLGFGMIADEKFEDPEDEEAVHALQRFNREAAQGGRFRATLLPTSEGLTVAVKLR